MPDLKGRVAPTPENSSQPPKKTIGAGKAEHVQKQHHPKKASFQKQNGISKGADSELSTESSDTKAQASSKVQDSSLPAEKAKVIGEPEVMRKLKQKSPKLQPLKKVVFLKKNAPKGTDSEMRAVLSLSKTNATPMTEDPGQSLGKGPFKKAAFEKQNGIPKGLQTPTITALRLNRPPPAKRRRSQSRGSSQ